MARNVTAMLPSGWNSYSPQQKINWFNANNVSIAEMDAAGVSNDDINWMLQNGYKPSDVKAGPTQAEQDLIGLYRSVLGREPDAEGLEYWKSVVGPTLEENERTWWMGGAQEELARAENKKPEEKEPEDVFSDNWFSLGPLEKQAELNSLLDAGYSKNDLLNIFSEQFNEDVTMADINTLLNYVEPEKKSDVVGAADKVVDTSKVDLSKLNSAPAFRDYIVQKYGRVNESNIQDVIKDAQQAGISNNTLSNILGASVPADKTVDSVSYIPNFALSERQQTEDAIAQLYKDELGRDPDAKGLNYYVEQFMGGRNIADIKAEIDFSEEGSKFDAALNKTISDKYGAITGDNLNTIISDLQKQGYSFEQVADAIGGTITTNDKGQSVLSYTPPAAAPKTFTDAEVSNYFSKNFGAITAANFSDAVRGGSAQGFSPEQIAKATGSTVTSTKDGFSFSLPPPPPKTFTNAEVQKLITDQFGSVTPQNFQEVVNAVTKAGVPADQFASVVGATIGTNDKGDTTLSLPAQETKPLSLVDQLKAQQQVTGITHQASFSKDQDAIIKDMAEKLGKYGVQSLEDLKPITGEKEYFAVPSIDDNGNITGYELYDQNPYPSDGPSPLPVRQATASDIAQLQSKGTITENVGVLNARTGQEIPVNELNNAKGSGFTYYKIEFSPDGVAVPYGFKEATGMGALGDQIKSIVSIPPIAAALAAVAAPIVGSALSVSAPTAAAISAGTVGYAGSGRLDTAVKAAATAFAVTYAMQAAGLDLKGDAKARVDAFKGVEGYDSLTRTVDLGNGLTYDPVLNTINDANLGTITDVSTGEVNFKGVDGVTYDSLDNVYEIRNPDGSITKIDAATGQQTTTAKTTSGFGDAVVTKEPATLEELNRIIFGDEFVGTNVGEGAASTTIPSGQTGQTVTVTGARGTPTSVGAGAAQVFPVTTGAGITSIPLAPVGQNQVEVTAPKPGDTGAVGAGAAGAGSAATGSTTAQVEVTKAKPGDTGSTGAGAGAGTAGTGTTKTTQDTVTVTGKKGDTSSAGAGAATVTTKPPGALTTGTKKITDGKFTELTAEEVEALVKAGLLVTTLVGSAVDTGGVTIPTTNVDTTLINTIRPGVKVDLNPTIPGATTTTLTPGQQTYNLLGINAGTPTTQPTVPTTGIGSLPVPTYKPPPFLGGPAPGASRITPPVLTADPTLTQADFETAAKEIARQQAALPPITQPIPATPFESGLAKGTTVVKRAGGIVALRGGGIPMFQMGGPVAFSYGGMTAPVNQPRMLSGGGDGMSDSIPATIDGTQPARLADGEFVIPADVVSDIGNGSSKAGATQLYAMMDRVRQARHGTTKQPPEVNMKKVLPV